MPGEYGRLDPGLGHLWEQMSTFLGLSVCLPFFVVPDTDESAADSLSLKRYTTSRGIQRWRWRFEVEPVRRGPSLATLARHRAQQGLAGRFDFAVPQLVDVGRLPAITVRGGAGANAVRLTIPAGSIEIPDGLFVAFGSARKIYQVTARVAFSSTADARTVSLPIIPALVVAAAGSFKPAPAARVMYAADGREGLTLGRRGVSRVTVELVEALGQ